MIRIAFPASWLTVAMTIEDDSNVVVSSWVMTQLSIEANGTTWYGYDFTGTAGLEYHIQADAGSTFSDPEIRYFDMWIEEPSVGWGGWGWLTPQQATQLANTVKKTDMILDSEEWSISLFI